MILIAHRGNVRGPQPDRENTPAYIEAAILSGFDVEIDIWGVGNRLYLGHDAATMQVDREWLNKHANSLWVHCKNVDALSAMLNTDFNYFFHHVDAYTITSKGYVWAYPGSPPAKKDTIAVMPESFKGNRKINLYQYAGVCSDFVGMMESFSDADQ